MVALTKTGILFVCASSVPAWKLSHFCVSSSRASSHFQMAIGCPVDRTGLRVVRHLAAALFHAAGQDHLLVPPLGRARQKIKVLLKKEFAYLLFRRYDLHKAFPLVFCGYRRFQYSTSGLCLPFFILRICSFIGKDLLWFGRELSDGYRAYFFLCC